MHGPVKLRKVSSASLPSAGCKAGQRLRARVLISKDLPVTQIEIEVIAALLDDWENMVSSAPQEPSK